MKSRILLQKVSKILSLTLSFSLAVQGPALAAVRIMSGSGVVRPGGVPVGHIAESSQDASRLSVLRTSPAAFDGGLPSAGAPAVRSSAMVPQVGSGRAVEPAAVDKVLLPYWMASSDAGKRGDLKERDLWTEAARLRGRWRDASQEERIALVSAGRSVQAALRGYSYRTLETGLSNGKQESAWARSQASKFLTLGVPAGSAKPLENWIKQRLDVARWSDKTRKEAADSLSELRGYLGLKDIPTAENLARAAESALAQSRGSLKPIPVRSDPAGSENGEFKAASVPTLTPAQSAAMASARFSAKVDQSRSVRRRLEQDLNEHRGEKVLSELRGEGRDKQEALARKADSDLEALRKNQERLYLLRKLSQRADLVNGANKAELQELDRMLELYEGIVGAEPTGSVGRIEAGEFERAKLGDLHKRLGDLLVGKDAPAVLPPGAAPLAGTPRERDLAEKVERVERLKAQAQAELAQRDAAAKMLALADRMRGGALRRRRDEGDMTEFRKNFARLGMVMDLSYSLNVLKSGEEALTGMKNLIDGKIGDIASQRERSKQARDQAKKNSERGSEWNEDVRRNVEKDKDNEGLFTRLGEQAGKFVDRLGAYGVEVRGLLDLIDARDGGRSGSALTEYERRLAFLPTLAEYRRTGYPGDDGSVSKLSLTRLNNEIARVDDYITKVEAGEKRFDDVPVEFAGVLVIAVPGIPAVTVSNPDAETALEVLRERRTFWQAQRADFQKLLDGVLAATGSGSVRVADDFGDSVPESLHVYLSETRGILKDSRADAQEQGAKIDAAAQIISASGAGSLPPLSGRSIEELRTLLVQYVDKLDALSFPDTDDGRTALIEKLQIARRLPRMGDAVVRWAEADAKAKIIENALGGILTAAKNQFTGVVRVLDEVLEDITKDEAYIRAGFPASEGENLISRKRALVSVTLKPMLLGMRTFLSDRLVPFQQDQIESVGAEASGDNHATLYKEKANLYRRVKESYEATVPWSLASQGAAKGDASGARANIQNARKKYDEYRKLIVDYQDEIRRRKDPSNTEVEEVYGEMMSFSLVKRIPEMRAETDRRAQQINSIAAEVNSILSTIDQRTGGKHGLSSYTLPTGITRDAGAKARLESFVDAKRIQTLADILRAIADEALKGHSEGGIEIGGGEGGIPTGTQPDTKLPDNQHTAMLALDAIKRIVPSTQASNIDSFTEVMARYLFTYGVAEASRKSLEEQIPIFIEFLDRGEAALGRIYSDLDADAAYVGSPGGSPQSLFDRKIAAFSVIRDIANEGAKLFNQKVGWDKESFDTVEDIQKYYDSMGEIYDNSSQALDAELEAAEKYKAELQKALDPILAQKKTVLDWLKQLNDPHESALRRVADNISTVQEKTKGVLESNVHYQRNKSTFDNANESLQKTLKSLEREQGVLKDSLGDIDLEDLSPQLADRIDGIGLGGPAWLAAGPRGPQSLIIKKSEFGNFLGMLFGHFEGESSARDVVRLREELLKNPMALAQLLPNSKMLELGDDPDGFYMVYNSKFSTPGGLESESGITLGNALRIGDNNVSVIGHRFVSPPSPGNAPFGDQGVTVRVESLQGANWVNYLDVTFHKFIQDIPGDIRPGSQVAQSRMMVFEDFAVMLAGDRLYFGAAGFGDFALNDPMNKPHYYGGNFKTSIKFSEVMKVTAEESILFAKDPRRFLQTVNLDFTGFDPTLDRDFVIDARGDNKRFRREKVGVELDLQKQLNTAESFQLDFFGTQVAGTDDIDQKTIGATILKGFAFNVGGIPVRNTTSASGELGTQYNTGSLRTSFELPNQGIVLSAQGKFLGDASSYLLEARKKFGDNTEAFLSWGSRYVGINNRLTLGVNTVFTLGQLWRSVAGHTGEDLLGGKTLEEFNKNLVGFFERREPLEPIVAELRRVFDADIGRRLISLEVGNLTRDIAELRRAGAILDNSKVRGMVGFVTNPVGETTVERAAGGGFQVGTQTELSMTKTQKALIEKKLSTLYAGGLRMQVRLLELTKRWQETVAEILDSLWERELAAFMELNAPNEAISQKGTALRIEAEARYRQAQLQYNLLTGRMPDAKLPFDAVNPQDMDALMVALGGVLAQPYRLRDLFGRLDPSQLPTPEESFNLMDWIPWIEKLTITVGVQLQDVLANQILGASIALRLPVYDPHSGHSDKALMLQSGAIIDDMLDVYGGYRLRAFQEVQEAASYEAQVKLLADAGPDSAAALSDAIRQYRNGLVRQDGLWTAFERWHWTITQLFDARAKSALRWAWAALDIEQSAASPVVDERQSGMGDASAHIRDLASALDAVRSNSHSLEGLAKRSQAVGELLEMASRRIEKVAVDVNIGLNVTADGVGWIPALGMTGLGIFPIVSVRMKPEELKELETGRRMGESKMLDHLKNNLDSELAFQFFTAYASYRGVQNTLGLLETEILPAQLEAANTGAPAALLALHRTRTDIESLLAQERSLLVTLNYLMGRPEGAALELRKSPEEVLAELQGQLRETSPLEARLGVLRERVEVAHKVETIVDKNLKVQDIRVEPISLIGRSLGRLISALSGSGDASPELVALARHQTLEAERDLRAFEKNLPAVKARLNFELEKTERRIEELRYSADPRVRIEADQLRIRIVQLRGQMAMMGFGAQSLEPASGGLPGSFAELENRLIAAFTAKTPSAGIGGSSDSIGLPAEGQRLTADGTLRYYHARQSIGKDPIGKDFIEGWVEVRLKSRTTPPETLLALAGLQKDKADQLHRAAIAKSSGRARILLARLRLNAGLLRWAKEDGRNLVNRLWLERLESGVRTDLNEVAAHLGLRRDIRTDALLGLIPREEAVSPQETARLFLDTVYDTNLEALRSALFEKGLPDEFAGSGDTIVQLKANLIAEKMSFKGFTPMGAFGIFRGRWVSGVFLEAPDPKQIEKSLEGILSDALRQELQAQERLKTLALKLHSLMASVADKSRLLEAQQVRLETTRENLAGTLALFARGQSTAEEMAAAQTAAVSAWTDFIDTLAGLRTDFVYLVTELRALGQPARGTSGAFRSKPRTESRVPQDAKTVSDLARYLSERLEDGSFESNLDRIFDGKGILSGTERAELSRRVKDYRLVRDTAETVRYHRAFDGAKRLELLTKLDVEGKRRRLEGFLFEAIARTVPKAGSVNPAWSELNSFLLEDISARKTGTEEQTREQKDLLAGMRRSLWESEISSPVLAKLFAGVESLRLKTDGARQALLDSYIRADEKPEDFILKDMALDQYLKALIAFDEAVLQAYASPDVRRSPRAVNALNALFPLRTSVERRRRLLKYGRGILAADALIAVEDSHLDALRQRRANPDEVDPIGVRLAFLKSLRDRWMGKPERMKSVYGVVDGDKLARWLTAEDIKGLERAKRVVVVAGERWLLAPQFAGSTPRDQAALEGLGAQRIVAGEDGLADELAEAQEKLDRSVAASEVAAVLEESEFVLVGPDGHPTGKLTMENLRQFEAEGRILYFSSERDHSGLRRALHPIAAQRKTPSELVVVLGPEGQDLFGHYGSLEALQRSPEAAKFQQVKTGQKGLRRLLQESGDKARRARQMGWVNLKLEAYAFALDKEGEVAAVYMNDKELKAARKEIAESPEKDDPRRQWRFFETADLDWGLDAGNRLAAVRIRAGGILLEFEGEPSRWITGEVFAVELDPLGALARIFQDKKELMRLSDSWWIEDMSGRLWQKEDFFIDPTHRLKRYIDNQSKLPVLLGRGILQRRLEEAKDELGDIGRWSYMPWNWANIVLETPRGIIKTPIELVTGRDPNQHGYIGRVYMYRRDGGATQRRGPLGKIVHFLDIFELLPDPVDRYMDPSQFPDRVENDGALRPGEWEHEKNPRTDKKKIHFGAGSLLRYVRYASEDVEDARSRILGAFNGGVKQTYVETVRGREGTYPNARIDHQVGSQAVDNVLGEMGGLVGSGGSGVWEADPGHIEVDSVRAETQIRIGARQHENRAARLQAELEKIPDGTVDIASGLEDDVKDIDRRLTIERRRRAAADALAAVGPLLRDVVTKTAFPYLTLTAAGR